MSYNTTQKKLILECLIDNKTKCINALEILEHLKTRGYKVGLTTIYRYLDSLEKEETIKKFNESSTASYQYINKDKCKCHYHLKCTNCGKLIHLNCNEVNTLESHIANKHGFEIDNIKTVIYGKCNKCKE